MGDVASVLLGELVINVAGWNWSVFTLLFTLLLFSSSLLFYLLVEECPMEVDDRSLTTCQKLYEQLNNLKQNFTHSNRLGVILEHAFLAAFYYNLLLWFPFYFNLIDYGRYASYLSIIFPICLVLGNVFFQNFIKLCPTFTHWTSSVFHTLTVIINLALFLVNKADENASVELYFCLIIASSFIMGGPYTQIGIHEYSLEIEGDRDALYYMMSMFALLRSLINLFVLFLISYFMELGKWRLT